MREEKIAIISAISIIFLVILTTGVLAVGFSPISLTFNLEKGKQDCQKITLTSESETITVSDKWAENKDVEWKVSLFDKNADYHSINIDYPTALSVDEREVEVCLSGDKAGEYHGVLLLTEGQEGNSIIQMGVWLKVIITEPQQQQQSQTQTSSSSSSESSGGGGGGGIVTSNSQTNNNQNQDTTTTEQVNEEENNNAGITGAVIGGTGKSEKVVGITLVSIGAIGLFLYGRRKLR
jgi:hypothetical protein